MKEACESSRLQCSLSEPRWIQWARELQAIAQTGLSYSERPYDRRRYQRVLELSAEIFEQHTEADPYTIRTVFDKQTGYATPKVDVRGVVFSEERLLLVRERQDGLWSLPGGWADVTDSPSEAVEREIFEESGYSTKATRLIALFDQAKHPHIPPYPFRTYQVFIQCSLTGGAPNKSFEISEIGFFGRDEIPPLSSPRVTPDQIAFCFDSRNSPSTPCRFD